MFLSWSPLKVNKPINKEIGRYEYLLSETHQVLLCKTAKKSNSKPNFDKSNNGRKRLNCKESVNMLYRK